MAVLEGSPTCALTGALPSTTNGRSGVDGSYAELEPLAASLADANSAAARNSGLAESCSRSLRGVRLSADPSESCHTKRQHGPVVA